MSSKAFDSIFGLPVILCVQVLGLLSNLLLLAPPQRYVCSDHVIEFS